jgi:hypothetical protein
MAALVGRSRYILLLTEDQSMMLILLSLVLGHVLMFTAGAGAADLCLPAAGGSVWFQG